jgi:hypothetical protein
MADSELPFGLQLCRMYMEHAQNLLKHSQGILEELRIPPCMPFQGLADLEKMMGQYLEAWQNRGL